MGSRKKRPKWRLEVAEPGGGGGDVERVGEVGWGGGGCEQVIGRKPQVLCGGQEVGGT